MFEPTPSPQCPSGACILYGKARHVLFRVGSELGAWSGPDWEIERVTDIVRIWPAVNFWPPHRCSRSAPAFCSSGVVSIQWTHQQNTLCITYWTSVGHPAVLVEMFKALIDPSTRALVMCQDHRELCFSRSLIKVQTPSDVLLCCSANEP